MKRILVILFAIVLFASCSRVSGTYVSDGGGLVEQIEFVGKNSCVLTYFGMKLPASYRMDKGHIVADAGQNLIVMFKVQDSNTLIGESEWNNAIYRKGQPIRAIDCFGPMVPSSSGSAVRAGRGSGHPQDSAQQSWPETCGWTQ